MAVPSQTGRNSMSGFIKNIIPILSELSSLNEKMQTIEMPVIFD